MTKKIIPLNPKQRRVFKPEKLPKGISPIFREIVEDDLVRIEFFISSTDESVFLDLGRAIMKWAEERKE
jgi:hypothetical protein